MGRVCNGPRVLWAEFAMGRDVPEPLDLGHANFGRCRPLDVRGIRPGPTEHRPLDHTSFLLKIEK